jgi:hypothetical protein
MRPSRSIAVVCGVFTAAAALMACESETGTHGPACGPSGATVSRRSWVQACSVMESVNSSSDGADAGGEDGGVPAEDGTDVRAEGVVVAVRPYSSGCAEWIGPADPTGDVEGSAHAYEIDFGEYEGLVLASWEDGGPLFEVGDAVTYLAGARSDFWSDNRFIALYDARGDLVLWAGQGTAPRPHHLDGDEILRFGAVECGDGPSCVMRVRVSDESGSVSLGGGDVAEFDGYRVVTDMMIGNSLDTYSCGNPFRIGLARLP